MSPYEANRKAKVFKSEYTGMWTISYYRSKWAMSRNYLEFISYEDVLFALRHF
jgi:hypothetical protein